MQNVELKAGELICFSSGSYSDYGYNGHFVCLQDVKAEEVMKISEECERKREESWSEGNYIDVPENFIATLIKRGYLLSIDCREIYCGSYGRLDLS